MPLTGVYGSGGSGKTIIVMFLLSKMPNIQKYGNFDTKLPNWQMKDTLSLFELPETQEKTIMVYDEAYTELDNRQSMSIENIASSYLLFQARKNNMSMVAISQLNILDIRWRGLERFAIYCKDRPIYDKRGNDNTDNFHYVFVDGTKYIKFCLPYKVAKKLFPLYETKQKIFPKGFEEMKAKMKLKNPKEVNKEVEKMIELLEKKVEIPEDKKMITHDWLKNALMDIERSFILEPYIYVRLRNRAHTHTV